MTLKPQKQSTCLSRLMGTRKLLWITLLVFVVGTIVFLLLPSTGDWVPSIGPEESNRVWHPDGFSIVLPSGWGASVQEQTKFLPASINAGPKRSKIAGSLGLSYRQSPSISVMRYRSKPVWPFDQAEQWGYQDQPSWRVLSSSGAEYGYVSLDIVFSRRSDWFRVLVNMPHGYGDGVRGDVIPKIFEQYLESFQSR